jgi:hypothetical protein
VRHADRAGREKAGTHRLATLCIGLWADDNANQMGAALLRTTEDILNLGQNNDGKRTIRADALADAVTWPVQPGPRQPFSSAMNSARKVESCANRTWIAWTIAARSAVFDGSASCATITAFTAAKSIN